jgi:hypothetical protein
VARFILFTKTAASEPPRLRHQLARLLAAAGHDVIFFQKPRYPWQAARAAHAEGRIRFEQHSEALHHKLRLNTLLRGINAAWVTKSLSRAAARLGFGDADVVVNFNYDYCFLRQLFPRNRIITIINDDYLARALFGHVQPLETALRLTCQSSDRVLTVSAPLQRQLARFCAPELFLPWADQPYRAPAVGAVRDTLLFWGFLNRKIDFVFVSALAAALAASASGIRLLFVGPVESHQREVDALRAIPGVELRPSSSLDALPLERVFGGFIPYRGGDPELDAITWPNKALPLLSRGLPLVIRGMPEFFAAPFVFRLENGTTVADVEAIRARFDDLQPAIAEFVARNDARARLEQFLRLAG